MAPALYWGGQDLAAHGIAPFLGAVDFHSFFDRAILVAAVALLWPLVRSLKISRMDELGLKPNVRRGRDLGSGLAIALASSLALAGCAWLVGAWHPPDPSRWARVLAILPTAAVVATLEEALFRGAIQGAVQRSAPKAAAMIFVAALFAIVHFLKPPENAIPAGSIGWGSGFAVIPLTFWQFHHLATLLGGFTTLFLVALILGYARLRTASLWMPIGLHAGWVIGKSIGLIGWAKPGKNGLQHLPWFGADLLTGLCPVLILVVTGALIAWRREAKAALLPPQG